ncbi:DNA polymerase-4 [Halanaerobium sp. DL-01]|uniref:DNA polymerase IV n=1 Tax=Halanaerobium sp. DL-01 TaxID=1653064 RepID=UPI000DF17C0C|nr:DNA polymerase IV [Halanaerobium sp. DL-01]RCW81429.1 DNA polymerase-4 [Halanaerobium sp. DL-01]
MNNLHIIHADMDAFFAEVERIDNPKLEGKAVIIGGVGLGDRGVVSTASYEARKYGVHSAMPIAAAKKLCPDGIYLPARHKRYSQMSAEIFDILTKYTPLIEKISIDEAFLDIKGCERLYGKPLQIAEKIKKEVYSQTGLKISIGLSVNKFLAKLASDFDKPDGLTVVSDGDIKTFLKDLHIDSIWGVGSKFKKSLNEIGINYVKDIWPYSLTELENLFGKSGVKLYYLSRGIDERKVEVRNEIKSVSHEETFFDNVSDYSEIMAYLFKLSEKVSFRLRENNFYGKIIFVKIRYDNFSTVSRQMSFKRSFNSTDEIYKFSKKLIDDNNLVDKEIRLLGVGVSGLVDENKRQLNLFENNKKNNEKRDLDKIVDDLKRKYGFNSISKARKLFIKDKK